MLLRTLHRLTFPALVALLVALVPLVTGTYAVAGTVVLEGPPSPGQQSCAATLQLSLYGKDSWMGHATLPAGESHSLAIPDEAYPVEVQANVRTACEAFIYSTPLRCKPLTSGESALDLADRCQR